MQSISGFVMCTTCSSCADWWDGASCTRIAPPTPGASRALFSLKTFWADGVGGFHCSHESHGLTGSTLQESVLSCCITCARIACYPCNQTCGRSCRTIPLVAAHWVFQYPPWVGGPRCVSSPPIDGDDQLGSSWSFFGRCSRHRASCRCTAGLVALACRELWWWNAPRHDKSSPLLRFSGSVSSGKCSCMTCFQAVLYWPRSTFSNSKKEWEMSRLISWHLFQSWGSFCWPWTQRQVFQYLGGLWPWFCYKNHCSASNKSWATGSFCPMSFLRQSGVVFHK